MIAIKSIKQYYETNQELLTLMETFRQMVNECIRIGLKNNICNLKKLSSLHYKDLKYYNIQAKYKLTAMSQACGRISQMKYAIKQGKTPKSPYIQKPFLVSYYGFKINGRLLSIPIKNQETNPQKSIYVNIILNPHTQKILTNKSLKVKSFVITPQHINLCIQKKVEAIKYETAIGIDRNLRNVTIANNTKIIQYDMSNLPKIKQRFNKVLSSFKRNDHRIMQRIYSKLSRRKSRRTKQFLNRISKDIIQRARESKSIIILENLKGIRKLYKKGNGQGRNYRGIMNDWQFYELQRQIQYKANWEGIPVEFIDPKGTSQLCPICGFKVQEDKFQHRQLWCSNCKKSMDRDVLASLNISYKGWLRFIHPSCDAIEAMKGNLETPVILRVDASKLGMK